MTKIERLVLYGIVVALGLLYIIHYAADSASDTTQADSAITLSGNGRIYYVNTDSVWDKYLYVREVLEMLNKKKAAYENQMKGELQKFERDVVEFREKGTTMTGMEAQIKQRDLARRESELSMLKEDLEGRFFNEEREWNDKIRAKIIGFIDSLTADKPYDYILGYAENSNIILANDSLDLTGMIIEKLNTEYKSAQKPE